MLSSGLIQLAKISEPRTFEQLCKDALATKFGLEANFYGRRGQKQHGIDLIAPLAADRYVVAQCKNYLKPYASAQGEAIRRDVEAAAQQQVVKISR